VSDVRGIARLGICLPQECVQSDLDYFGDVSNGFINWGISLLPYFGIYIDNLVFKPGS
jgi:hypothetical protein